MNCSRGTAACLSDELHDITDGNLNKKLCMKFSEVHSDDDAMITLMLSTDGAPVFKSVNCSIWPLYACVLELPVATRFVEYLPHNMQHNIQVHNMVCRLAYTINHNYNFL